MEATIEEAPKVISERTEFFIGELSYLDDEWKRKYQNLSSRVTALEDGNKKPFNDDPLANIGMVIGAIMLIQIAAPILELLVKRWSSE